MLTQKLRGNFKALQRVPDAKGAQGRNFASIARENLLTRLVMEEMRDGTESILGKGQWSALLVLGGQIPEICGGNEVHSELQPSGSSVELTGERGPGKLSPVPCDRFQNLKALPGLWRVEDPRNKWQNIRITNQV